MVQRAEVEPYLDVLGKDSDDHSRDPAIVMKLSGAHPVCDSDSSISIKCTLTCVYIFLVWCVVFGSGKAIPYEEFIGYPFDTSNGYQLFPRGDDLAQGVTIPFPFPYFNQSFTFADISLNGYISLTNETQPISTAYTPMDFPLAASNIRSATLAPFWADVDTRGSGRVVYKAVNRSENTSLTSHIESTVATSLTNLEDFTATWVLIVTWDHVGYYSGNIDKLNTFQVVLATDGLKSVAIFNFAKDGINWVTGDANGGSGGFGGSPAVAGYNVGDGIRYFKFPGSLTEDIQFIDDISGNLGQQGQWVFRLDLQSSILRTCQVDKLFLNTRIINSLGGDPIIANYTCVEGVEEAFCIFDDAIEQPAELITQNQYLCSSPTLSKWGYSSFALRVIAADGTEIVRKTSLSVASPDHGAHVDISAATSITVESDEVVDITWSPTLLQNADPTSNLVDISIYELSRDGSLRFLLTLAKDIPNSGSAQVKLALNGSTTGVQPISPVFFQVSLAKSHVSKRKRGLSLISTVAIWSAKKLLQAVALSASLRALCEVWHASEDPNIGEDLLAETVCCPRTVTEANWPTSGLQRVTGIISKVLEAFFHPDAHTCYRQIAPREGSTAGQQCCYKSDGKLLVGPNSGGTVDRYAPVDFKSFWQHQWYDVIPFILCCKGFFSDCSKYYDRRPSHNGENCSPIPPACVYGDPHIVTLDGHKYTFNGKGEFLLIETLDGSFVLQGRMADAPGGTGNINAAATVFTALAAKQINSDTVQIELSDEFLMRINGDVYAFDVVNEETFNNVLVSKGENNSYSATFSSGIYIEARVAQTSSGPYISAFIVSMPKRFRNSVKGLMGNYNGDISDDFVPNGGGEPLPLNSSLAELHWNFGVTWILDGMNESLFTYDQETSFEDLHQPMYTPVFEANFTDPELRAEAEEMCQGNEYCLFDIAATGDTSIGMTTLAGVQELEAIVNASWPVLCNPPCVRGACIINDSCSCSEGYTGERCAEAVVSPCSVNICGTGGSCSVIGVSSVCTCYSGYSGLFCEDVYMDESTSQLDTINVGAVIGGVVGSASMCILASVVIIMIICCLNKRRKPHDTVTYHVQGGTHCEVQAKKTISDCREKSSTEACNQP